MIDRQVLEDYAAKMSAEQGREIHAEQARDEIHRIVIETAKTFGGNHWASHESDDVVQQAAMYGLEVLNKPGKYDPARSLGPFLWTHMRNKLSNLKRSEYFRAEVPCSCHDMWDPGPEPCERWQRWAATNANRQALSCVPQPEHYDPVGPHEDPADEAIASELGSYIQERLPEDLIDDFRLLVEDPQRLGPDRRQRVKEACREIVRYSPHTPFHEPPPTHHIPPPKPSRPRKPKGQQVTYLGRSQNLRAWSEAVGVSPNRICMRLRWGWSPGQALGLEPPPMKPKRVRATPRPKPPRPPKPKGKQITWRGETHCLREWERILGVTHGRISRRLRSGMTVDDAFAVSPRTTL